jgi:CheY-like chemotaxis protein
MDPKVPQVLVGDPSKLSQVLLNLMGNAIKFVEKGHVSLAITHKGVRNGYHELQFTVEDTGIGISKEQLKHIFERFQQVRASSSQKQEGTGLGLSIVKKIIEHQDGHIRVSSTEGEGPKFIFTIPYKEGKEKRIAPRKELQQIVKDGRNVLHGTEILVFEDNTLNQRLIEEQLKKWGCRAYVTQDAQVGLDLLLKRPIALVLMDLKMPGLTGFEIAEKIRSLPSDQGGQVPIVALSADFTAQDEEQCRIAGINDFLLKPYTLEALLTKVTQHKKEAQLHQESLGLLQKPVIQNEGKSPICLDPLLEDCFGKVDVLEELVRLLKQNISEFIGSVKISMEATDYHGVALAAHKLKAGLSMVHANGLKCIVVSLEERAKQNQGEEVAQLYHDFLKALPAVENAMNDALNQLKNG